MKEEYGENVFVGGCPVVRIPVHNKIQLSQLNIPSARIYVVVDFER
jgi:hypothetical protein